MIVGCEVLNELRGVRILSAHENPFSGHEDILEEQVGLGDAGVRALDVRGLLHLPPVTGPGRFDNRQTLDVPGDDAGDRKIFVRLTVDAARKQEDLLRGCGAADHVFGAADHDAVVADLGDPEVGVGVRLLRRLETAIALGIGQGAGRCESLFFGHQDPLLQPLLVVGAELLVHLLGDRPEDILSIPTDTDRSGAASGAPVVLTFHLHVVNKLIRALHHGIPAHDFLARKNGGRGVYFRQLRVVGRVVGKGVAFDRSFGGRVRRDVLDELAEFVDIRTEFFQRCQVLISGFDSHHTDPFLKTFAVPHYGGFGA